MLEKAELGLAESCLRVPSGSQSQVLSKPLVSSTVRTGSAFTFVIRLRVTRTSV